MPEAEAIIQQIDLVGADDVTGKLTEIGKAGEEAFGHIAKALGPLGEALAAFAGAITGLTAGLAAWAEHSAKAAHGMEMLAAQTGESIESISSLQGALSALGGDTERLGMMFMRMGLTISRTWEQVKKDVASAADRAFQDTARIEHAENALFHAQQNRLRAEGRPGATPQELRYQKRKEATEAEEEAEHRLAQARKQRHDDQMNSFEAYSKAVRSITTGEKTYEEASKDANLNVNNVLKGLVGTAEGAEEALKAYHGSLSDIVGMGPKAKEVLYNFADYLKNAHNATQEQAIAMRLFGRNVGQDVIEPLRKLGSTGIRDLEEQMKRSGMVMTEEMVKPATEFHLALSRLSHDMSMTSTQMGLMFAPAFTQQFQQLSKYIEENHDKLLQWAQSMSAKVAPAVQVVFDAIRGLVAAMAGDKLDPSDTASKWAAAFTRMGEVISTTAEIVVGAVKTIKTALDTLTFGHTGELLEGLLYLGAGRLAFKGIRGLGRGIGGMLGLGGEAAAAAGGAGAVAGGGLGAAEGLAAGVAGGAGARGIAGLLARLGMVGGGVGGAIGSAEIVGAMAAFLVPVL